MVNNNVHNAATVYGTPPLGPDVSATDDHDVTIPPPGPENSIELVKDGPAVSAVGETITYTFDVTNTGDQTLTNVHITDTVITDEPIAVTPTTLAPDAEGTVTATYTLREADAVNNNVHNVATVYGTPPAGEDVTDLDDHDVTIIPQRPPPGIELVKDGPASARVARRSPTPSP